MTTLAHQHIANRLNRRAEIARENQRMDEIEKHATPLFYAVIGVAAAVVLWMVTADYRDVAQHRMDTFVAVESARKESALMARCARQEIVPFDDVMSQCTRLKLMKGLK